MSRIQAAIILLPLLLLAGCVSEPSPPSPPRKPVVDLDAVLPPRTLLRKDTIEALEHDRNASRLAYVGVWASDGDRCAMMDQTAFKGYAVITPGAMRRSTASCSFEPGTPGETAQHLNASCKSGKTKSARTLVIQMLDSQTLYLGTPDDQPGEKMVRCRLQGPVTPG